MRDGIYTDKQTLDAILTLLNRAPANGTPETHATWAIGAILTIAGLVGGSGRTVRMTGDWNHEVSE